LEAVDEATMLNVREKVEREGKTTAGKQEKD
jgi:hypothetical protein